MRLDRLSAVLKGLVVLCVMVPMHSRAQVEVEGFYWLMTLEGDAAVGLGGIVGTDIDLESDLGYGDEEAVPGATLVLGDDHQFGVTFFQLDVSANSRINRPIRFSNLDFAVDAAVKSDVEATLVRGFYRWMIGNDTLRGGPVLGGQYFDVTAKASAEGIGRASAQVEAGMPVVGLAAEARPAEWLSLRAGGVGIRWDIDDVEITYIDLDALVSVTAGPIYGGVGYRHIIIDGEDGGEPITADLTFSGPVAVIGLNW
jgi:hypothetical protein